MTMDQPSPTFDHAWAAFQARDYLRLAADTLEGEWARGRDRYLAFLARVDDPAACRHIARIIERIAAIPGVQPYPGWYWHITVKPAGFEVQRATRSDELADADAPRLAQDARPLLTSQSPFPVRLGLVSAFPEVVFLEVWDGGRVRGLNQRLLDALPLLPRYPVDGPAFLPHVSVARFTSNDGLPRLKTALAVLRAEGPGPSFPIRQVELIRAHLSPQPPTLETVATYPLAGLS